MMPLPYSWRRSIILLFVGVVIVSSMLISLDSAAMGVIADELATTNGVLATDPRLRSGVSFAIIPTNSPPEFTSEPDTSATVGALYEYEITTTDPDEGDSHTITALVKPAWLTLDDNLDGSAVLYGTPSVSDLGDHPVTLQVTDNASNSNIQSFIVTVRSITLSGQVKDIDGFGLRRFAYVQIWEADDTGLRIRWLDNILTDLEGYYNWSPAESEKLQNYVIYIFPIEQWLIYEAISASSVSGTVLDPRTIYLAIGPALTGEYSENDFVLDFRPTPTATPTPTPTATPADRPQTGDELTVNTVDDVDDGLCSVLHCTLREAINQVNAPVGMANVQQNQITTLRFDSAAMGGTIIQPKTQLPSILQPVIINGSTVSGGKITLNGSQAGDSDGLVITGGGSTVQGLVINGFTGSGVVLNGSGGNTLLNNFIGTSADGQSASGNSLNGIDIQSSSNTIGGTYYGAANLISANGDAGISVSGNDNRIIGNFIGSNVEGTSALGNSVGIRLIGSSNVVGGSQSGARNLISGNSNQGLLVQGSDNNSIIGNLVGVGVDSISALGNTIGILVTGATANQIGGVEPGSGNIIGHNSSHGLQLSASDGNLVRGNWIGTQLSGANLGQGGDGIRIDGGSNDNIIGGPVANAANTIAFNAANGIVISGSTGNSLIGNSIYENDVSGIENTNGGNNELQVPEIINIAGNSVSGFALANATVEVFADASNQGRHFLGRTVADDSGSFVFSGQLIAGQITATATDADGDTSEFAQSVEREVDCEDSFEPNNTWTEGTIVEPGQVLTSLICDSNDLDFYRLSIGQIERGSRVVITLSGHTVDLDMALFRPTEIGDDLPGRDIPNENLLVEDIPVESLPLTNIPLTNIPLTNIPLTNIPLTNIPLTNIPLVSHSVQRGTASEQVSDIAYYAVDHYYILVGGYNGAYSADPYTLTVEVLPPATTDQCTRDFPFDGTPGQGYQPFTANETETLILYPKERLQKLYGGDEVDALTTQLQLYAEHESVKGVIIPLELDPEVQVALGNWDDGGVCDVMKANEVTYAIKLRLARALNDYPLIKHILLVGNDEAIPHRRILDVVQTSNEIDYTLFSFTKPNTALFSAFSGGYMLTDDYYADLEPTLYRGRALYVPNHNLGRLVETPADMSAVLEMYLASQGRLEAQTGLVYGYDFLIDSSTQIAEAFSQQGLQTTARVDDIWTADDLRQDLLYTQRQDLASVNAHFAHFLLQPADLVTGGLFSATEIAGSVVDLSGTINYSVGCHSGLNVCDVCTTEFGQEFDADFDFAQAFAAQGAWYIANTGFAYGDTAAPTLSEELMSQFTASLGQSPEMAVGDALKQAKQRYALHSMGAYGPYDEKVLAISTLYGLPNYRVTVPTPQPIVNPHPDPGENFEELPNGLLKRTIDLSLNYQEVETETGTYFTTGSGYQALLYNPIQPRALLDVALEDSEDRIARGALLISGAYSDIGNFDPVITMPVSDTTRYEPQIIYDGWQPPEMTRINHFQSGEERMEQLILTLGQFLHTDVVTDPISSDVYVVGIERLLNEVRYELHYSNSTDYIRPSINHVGAIKRFAEDTTPVIDFVTSVNDDQTGVGRVLVTWTINDGLWRSLDLVFDPDQRQWYGSLEGVDEDIQFFVQALDGAGNVTVTAAKGRLYGVAALELFADRLVANEGEPVNFSAETTGSGLGEIAFVNWNYGDGYEIKGELESQHYFPDNGGFIVGALAIDSQENTATGAITIRILNLPPEVAAVEDIDAVVGQETILPTVTFTDPGSLDTHTALIDWGDGSTTERVIVNYEPGTRDPIFGVQGELEISPHIYQQTGIYDLTLCVSDKDGDTACTEAQVSVGEDLPYRQWIPWLELNRIVHWLPRIQYGRPHLWFPQIIFSHTDANEPRDTFYPMRLRNLRQR